MSRPDVAYELRRSLSDPLALCSALGLGLQRADRKGTPARPMVRCPRHGGVSCSVTRADDGTVRVHCFGCDFTGDALHLIAEVLGLDIRRHFREVLEVAAELARCGDLLRDKDPAGGRYVARPQGNDHSDAPRYPPLEEVTALWRACEPCASDPEVCRLLQRRGLRPDVVDELHLGRALPSTAQLPRWAYFRGNRPCGVPWTETGHRLVLPVYDAHGIRRSVRAWCVNDTDDPKRLPPAGYRASSLALACPNGVALLAAGRAPEGIRPLRVIIAEGEPDFLTWATRFSDACEGVPAILGVVSGAWTAAFAERVPEGSRVVVRTHRDAAGDRYAREIQETLGSRCTVLRARGA